MSMNLDSAVAVESLESEFLFDLLGFEVVLVLDLNFVAVVVVVKLETLEGEQKSLTNLDFVCLYFHYYSLRYYY